MATTVDEPLTPPPGPNVGFTSSWPVRAADIDPDTRVRLDGIARYLEDIAWENLQASMLPGTDPIWIVRRTVIDAVRPISWPDRVHLRRWCAGLSTRWTAMRVRMESSRGGLIESEGFWINISESTGMPTRISDEGLAYLQTMTGEHRLKWRRWLGEARRRNRGRTCISRCAPPTSISSTTSTTPRTGRPSSSIWWTIPRSSRSRSGPSSSTTRRSSPART